MPSAQPAFFCPNLSISVSAIFCAPPLASRIPPNMEPKPTSSAIPCSVFPTPFSTVSEIIDSGIPAPTPIITDESIIEIIGWSLKRIIKISSTAIPTTAAAINLTGSAAKTISSIFFLLSIHQMLFSWQQYIRPFIVISYRIALFIPFLFLIHLMFLYYTFLF